MTPTRPSTTEIVRMSRTARGIRSADGASRHLVAFLTRAGPDSWLARAARGDPWAGPTSSAPPPTRPTGTSPPSPPVWGATAPGVFAPVGGAVVEGVVGGGVGEQAPAPGSSPPIWTTTDRP